MKRIFEIRVPVNYLADPYDYRLVMHDITPVPVNSFMAAASG
jgi:hypothetical protein